MSIENIFTIKSKIINDVLNSDYEFNRFSKNQLHKNTRLNSLVLQTKTYSKWHDFGELFFETSKKSCKAEKNIEFICFLHSPWISKATRIIRHKKLGKFFSNEYDISDLKIVLETEFNFAEKIGYYGFLKITNKNAGKIYKMISDNENGVIFSYNSINSLTKESVANNLKKSISFSSKTNDCRINIAQAIEIILDFGQKAIFPHSWEETGSYHIDIFSKV